VKHAPFDSFKFMVHGETLDVDALQARSAFEFDFFWRRGNYKLAETDAIPATSGVEKHLGDGTSLPIAEQEEIACAFFERHRDALRELAASPGADIRILGLHRSVNVRQANGVGVRIGPRLMKAALETGFEPVYYVWFDKPSSDS